jgi:demethylmenaquinone methyltransferase/2-methoxy-6-polyprenyl-1,4-benzoquinol methylase
MHRAGDIPQAFEDDVSFGARQVPSGERQGLVNGVFSRVASNYDLMNDLMSGGLHRLWKDAFVAELAPPRGGARFAALDMAGGTGDIAARILARGGPGASVTLCDISAEMLAEGRKRLGAEPRAAFVQANAEEVPFPDRSFDAYTIAFGIRNVTHIDAALREAFRVLKPGGRFLCLEFSTVETPLLDDAYDAFSQNVIPALGQFVAGDRGSYEYLVESIRRFPDQQRFAAMIGDAGFARASYRNLTAGIAAIHSGWRI